MQVCLAFPAVGSQSWMPAFKKKVKVTTLKYMFSACSSFTSTFGSYIQSAISHELFITDNIYLHQIKAHESNFHLL